MNSKPPSVDLLEKRSGSALDRTAGFLRWPNTEDEVASPNWLTAAATSLLMASLRSGVGDGAGWIVEIRVGATVRLAVGSGARMAVAVGSGVAMGLVVGAGAGITVASRAG